MNSIQGIERPGPLLRIFYAIGRRMFGAVPTPEKLLAHRVPAMLGVGAFYGALEWFGIIDARLRALLNYQVARLHGTPY
jgi:hypothetical protein